MSSRATGSRYVHIQCVDDLLSIAAHSPAEAQAVAAHLLDTGKWLEVVPGISSIVVRYDVALLDARAARQLLAAQLAEGIDPLPESREVVHIPVAYGGEFGPDLEALCAKLGISQDAFIETHTGQEYVVDMVGFTPGFAFVGGLDAELEVPRRADPRQHVAAGSIAIAGRRTGMYAVASPGGWNLVGRTPFALFDARAADPFPIRAGTRIRYYSIPADEFDA